MANIRFIEKISYSTENLQQHVTADQTIVEAESRADATFIKGVRQFLSD
jgi:hypothetical protein